MTITEGAVDMFSKLTYQKHILVLLFLLFQKFDYTHQNYRHTSYKTNEFELLIIII